MVHSPITQKVCITCTLTFWMEFLSRDFSADNHSMIDQVSSDKQRPIPNISVYGVAVKHFWFSLWSLCHMKDFYHLFKSFCWINVVTIKLHCTSILHLNLSRMLIPSVFAVVSVHWMKKRQWKKEMKSNRDMMTWRRNLLNLLVQL